MNEKVVAIIVTYNINDKFIFNLKKYYNQFYKIIIVDNSTEKKSRDILKNIDLENINIIFNLDNIGLDKAQNIGIKEAFELKTDWIMFLDDDSELEKNTVYNLLSEYSNFSDKDKSKVGMLIPRYIDKNTNEKSIHILNSRFFPKRIKSGTGNRSDILTAISSGMLVKVEVIKKIGLLREDLFIDYIDIEYSLRIIENGYKIHLINSSYFYHSIGNKSKKSLFFKEVTVYNHSPIRRYYAFRNRFIIYKLYYKNIFKYVLYDFLVLNLEIIKILFLEKNKIQNFKYIYLGIKDFMSNKSRRI